MKISSLCYIENAGKYLMLYRNAKKNDENAGKWIGIGGKFEDGESPEDCVCREVLEETGLTLVSYDYRGIVTFVSDKYGTEYMHLFTADKFDGEISTCSEGRLEWIDKNKLDNLPMWEGDRVFLDLLGSQNKFFSLKLCYEGDSLISAVLDGKKLDIL
ncbi:MAG: 8-oxo-dGTP diphosphatase [Ruminococcaceae bacterium]|nr:8-oxo-dGTP diphosphatase [Oscillospiraceae bacterium]